MTKQRTISKEARNSEVSVSTMSGLELVVLLKNKSEEAFSEIVTRYSERVHNLSMRISRNSEDTEEIVQDVFVQVFRKIDLFEGKSAFSSWVYRITANTAFMKLRKRKQVPAISIEDISSSVRESWISDRREDSDTNYMSCKHELKAVLQKAIAELPEEYRAIFVLRDVDGLSNEEVSEVLAVSLAAVKSRLHRARAILKKKLCRFKADYENEDTVYSGSMGFAMAA